MVRIKESYKSVCSTMSFYIIFAVILFVAFLVPIVTVSGTMERNELYYECT